MGPLDLKERCQQDSSPSNGHQGDMPYCIQSKTYCVRQGYNYLFVINLSKTCQGIQPLENWGPTDKTDKMRPNRHLIGGPSLDPLHDDVIIWKHFPRYWPFVWGIHRSWWIPRTKASDGALIFSLICLNGWVNNHEAGDLRCYRAYYDGTVMEINRLFWIPSMGMVTLCSGTPMLRACLNKECPLTESSANQSLHSTVVHINLLVYILPLKFLT